MALKAGDISARAEGAAGTGNHYRSYHRIESISSSARMQRYAGGNHGRSLFTRGTHRYLKRLVIDTKHGHRSRQRRANRTCDGVAPEGDRLAPDFKTIADCRRDNGAAIRPICGSLSLCRRLKLFTGAVVAIDGSKFKAVDNRD